MILSVAERKIWNQLHNYYN